MPAWEMLTNQYSIKNFIMASQCHRDHPVIISVISPSGTINLDPRAFWVFFKMAVRFCGVTRHFEKYPEGPGDEVEELLNLGHFPLVRSAWPKRTGSGQLKWKGSRRARPFFPPQLSEFPHPVPAFCPRRLSSMSIRPFRSKQFLRTCAFHQELTAWSDRTDGKQP